MICPVCNKIIPHMMTSCFNKNEWWHDLLKEKEKQTDILRKVNKMRWEEMSKMKKEIEELQKLKEAFWSMLK